jgi:hypothetical protein
MPGFRFPGGDSRTTVIGATGTGKTTCGVWLLAHQRFDRRPWIIIDFKREQIFDAVGIPPIRPISLASKPPKRPGLYLVSPRPDEDDALEAFLWRVWERENIGLFVDEASLMPDRDAFRAVLQQGRSKLIPLISCTQRPVDVKRGLFSEASFFCIYRMQDARDYKTIQGFVPGDLSQPRPPHHWQWYDVARNVSLNMAPVPPPAQIAEQLRDALPLHISPFAWAQPVQRPATGRARLV